MDAEFFLTLASQSWLKWLSCPHCDSDCTISKTGRCTECNEHLVSVRSEVVGCNIINGFSGKLNSLIPWQTGSSFYYHVQWNQLTTSPIIDVHNS